MGFWAALEEIFPDHTAPALLGAIKRRNVLNAFPTSLQPEGQASLTRYLGESETQGLMPRWPSRCLCDTYDLKYPKATVCLQRDRETLLTFYAFPAAHWPSIRTTNPIESSFGTIRHRTTRTKGCLTRDGMLHMMFKLGQCAEKTWRRLRGFRELPKVVAGIQFTDGIEETTTDSVAA